MKIELNLPDTLSDLILVALEDMKKLPDNIRMDMNRWVSLNSENKVCSACLAGAVMVAGGVLWYSGYATTTQLKLNALNNIRIGDLAEALYNIKAKGIDILELDLQYQNERIPSLSGVVTREQIIDSMTRSVNWLKARNL